MKICLVFALSMLGTSAFAGSTDFVPLQQRAQGQSLTGASLMNDSLFSNPAASAFTNVYALDGTFLSPKQFSVSVLDTKTSSMGGALGYYRVERPGSGAPVQGARLGMAGRLSENFGIGALGKVVWGPDTTGANNRYYDMDIGMTGQFDFLTFGASVANVLGGNGAMGEAREYALGARVNWEQTVFFSAAMNGDFNSLRPTQFGLGAEYVSPYYFAIKGGFRYQPVTRLSYWSTGVSILSPKLSLHYALEIPNGTSASLEHSVGTTFLF
ncbi:hypothetical protein K2X33_07635 [bacterium]|nr:hypothetical protein [bacterium]